MFRVLPWAPPMARIFVQPGSGARRATETQTTRSMFRVLPWVPPMTRIFVKPGSGARRATETQTTRSPCRIGRPRRTRTS
jgi:hypothetical protein